MHLPTPIQTYFTAKAPQDGEAFAAAFAAEAIVHDEGQIHRGPEEIRAWWLAAKSRTRTYFFDRLENHNNREPVDVTMPGITVEHIFPQMPPSPQRSDGGDRLPYDALHVAGRPDREMAAQSAFLHALR